MRSERKEIRVILHRLYEDNSKHSRYQNIPKFVQEALGYRETINEEWRGDTARYGYILSTLDLNEQRVVDVGANTGFFTLSLAHEYRDSYFTAVEGNENHVNFIQAIVNAFKMNNVSVQHSYVTYDNILRLPKCNTLLLLNILHHAGVDFDNEYVSKPSDVADYAKKYFIRLRSRANRIIFQMGYNWGGNKKLPIIPVAEDSEKVIYTSRLFVDSGWTIKQVATAYKINSIPKVAYRNLAEEVTMILNKRQKDSSTIATVYESLSSEMAELSEFYRRPIFVCENQ